VTWWNIDSGSQLDEPIRKKKWELHVCQSPGGVPGDIITNFVGSIFKLGASLARVNVWFLTFFLFSLLELLRVSQSSSMTRYTFFVMYTAAYFDRRNSPITGRTSKAAYGAW
jgi:hypothetical protein